MYVKSTSANNTVTMKWHNVNTANCSLHDNLKVNAAQR